MSVRTFSVASLMQLCNKSMISSLVRHPWGGGGGGGEMREVAVVLRRLAAARDWARSTWSSFEAKLKKGFVVGVWRKLAIGDLCICVFDGLGLNDSSAIDA